MSSAICWKVDANRPWLKKKIWPERVPKSLGYRKETIPHILERSAKRSPGKISLIFLGKKITFGELNELSSRFANALTDLGTKRGDRVALLLPNCPQFVVSFFGALKAGAIIVTIDPLHMERELEYELNDTGAETLVTTNMKLTLPKIMNIIDRTKLKRVIVTSLKEYIPSQKHKSFDLVFGKELVNFPRRGDRTFHFKDLMKYSPEKPKAKIDSKNIALISCTGGTTGLPKGCVLTHSSMLANVNQCLASSVQYFPRENFEPLSDEFKEHLPVYELEKHLVSKDPKTALVVLPLYYNYGLTVVLMQIAGEAPFILLLRPKIENILEAIKEYKPGFFPCVTTLAIDLMKHPDSRKCDFTCIKVTTFSAIPVPLHVKKEWERLTQGYLVEAYGLTEASAATHVTTVHMKKAKSFGIPFPNTDAKVVDPDTGKDVPPDEIGELLIKGPQVMKGYWEKPEETAKVLREGWLHTGDLVKMDKEGFFYFVDREKDLIKYKGYAVFPTEVEKVLSEHPAVSLCAVVGKLEERVGEIPKAFVVLKSEYKGKIKDKELIDFCRDRIAPYKRIREVEFRENLPKSLTGKVLRKELRKEERARINNEPKFL